MKNDIADAFEKAVEEARGDYSTWWALLVVAVSAAYLLARIFLS